MSRYPQSRVLQQLAVGVLALYLAGMSALARELRIDTIAVAPFGFYTAAGQPTGIMYELGNLIAREAGFSATNQIVPYAQTVIEVKHGAADFVLRYGNDELTEVAIQVASVLSLPTIVLGLPSAQFRSLEDLHGMTVGVLRGGRFDQRFEADIAIRKYPVLDYQQMVKMLMAKHLDAGIGSTVGIYYSASQLGLKQTQLGVPLVLSEQHFVLHFSRKTADDATIAALQTAVERLKQRNAIAPLVDKYLRDFSWQLSKP
ncbi:MAG: transporter substrate-binding domain-containing protein [Pseudomonadaceae bacterium]|nr:transporter substrate-binding domain-containing protein [Pseudomonadaceae bacterium]